MVKSNLGHLSELIANALVERMANLRKTCIVSIDYLFRLRRGKYAEVNPREAEVRCYSNDGDRHHAPMSNMIEL